MAGKTKTVDRKFKLSDYFYSDIRKEFVDDYLKKEGDFLIRKGPHGQGFVISVFWKGKVRHINPTEKPDGISVNYTFGKNSFDSVEDLINYHFRKRVPFSDDLGTTLVCPVKCPKLKYKESEIELVAKIGAGNFGDVYQVKIKSENNTPAAMKTLKASVDKTAREGFEKEMNMMKTMYHENVVRMIGIVQVESGNKDEIKILLELINQGSLDKLLKKGKVTERGKCKICVQVAKGMEYLHKHHIIHRDLAARNVLVHRHDDGAITAKVSDFGLSRIDESGAGYCLRNAQKMPLKWMAPESFKKRTWTTASDVWSFGVLMWEVFTNGLDPYSTTPNISTAAQLTKYITEGSHPERPENIRDDIWNVMCSTWTVDDTKRPTMADVVTELEKIYALIKGS